MTKTNTKQENYGLLLFPNMLDYACSLCPEGSEPSMLLTALADIRFKGADPEETRSSLSGYNVIAFDTIAYSLIKSMNGYRNKCAQNASGSTTNTNNVVGGGMILQDDALRTLAFVAEGTETGAYFDALYQVHSGKKDPDTAESTLPRGARIVFMMTRNSLFGESQPKVEKKKSRSEINRENANKRWHPEMSTKSEESELPPEIADLSNMLDNVADTQSEQIPELPLLSSEVSSDADTPTEAVPIEVAESVVEDIKSVGHTEPMDCKVAGNSYENANGCKMDANPDSHTLYKNKKNIKKNNNTHPYTPTISYREQGCVSDKLLEEFDSLWQVYPKHEDRERSWDVFRCLNPDETLLAEIYKGLNVALKRDKRFLGEYRFTPTLRNWLLAKGWLAENMHHIEDPTGRHVNQTGTAGSSTYAQRPYLSQSELDERAVRSLQVLRERYGNSRD